MQIQRLRLVNFRQHEDTDLVFGAGLTGIVGPNGAGKTTLLEAIAYAIYGTSAARGTRDSIRRRGAPPRSPVRVELEFAFGAHHFRVVRTLNQAELYQDGDPAPVANSLGTVTERLSRMFGMSREEFFNTYFTGQKELAVMAAMSAPERSQFLSRVLGYERLRTAQIHLKDSRTALRARQETLRAGLPSEEALAAEAARVAARGEAAAAGLSAAEARLAGAEARIGEVRPRWEAMQQLRETVRSLEGDLRVAEHQVSAARERFQELDRRLAEAVTARTRLAELAAELEPLARLREERQALDRQAEAHAARAGLLGEQKEIEHQLEAIERRLAALPQPEAMATARQRLETPRRLAEEVARQAEERRTAWVRDTQDAKTKRQTLLDQYRELKEQHERIVAAGPDGACPTCARPLGREYQGVLAMLDRQLQDVLFNGNYFKQRIEQLKPEPGELRDLDRRRLELAAEHEAAVSELSRLEARTQEAPVLVAERGRLVSRQSELAAKVAQSAVPYDQARHMEIRRLVALLEPRELEAERLRGAADRAEELVQLAETAEQELSAREADAVAQRERLAGLGFQEQRFTALREEERTASEERRVAELQLAQARAEAAAAAAAANTIAERRAERAERERELQDTSAELLLRSELDRALTELRTDLNAALRPDLSELASAFLRDLTNGRYGDLELDEQYVPALVDEGEAKAVISGGEEDVANLALRLAISQMIAERAGQPLSLLVLDEIFGSLDEERRAAVLDLLRGLADRFPQVILITHIEAVRDGFDRIIRVDLDPERHVARVREEPATRGHHAAA